MDKKFYIVAGNKQEYTEYMRRKTTEFFQKGIFKIVYVESVDVLRGLTEVDGYYIGTYEQRPDIQEIKDAIAVIKSKPNVFGKSMSLGVKSITWPNVVWQGRQAPSITEFNKNEMLTYAQQVGAKIEYENDLP